METWHSRRDAVVDDAAAAAANGRRGNTIGDREPRTSTSSPHILFCVASPVCGRSVSRALLDLN